MSGGIAYATSGAELTAALDDGKDVYLAAGIYQGAWTVPADTRLYCLTGAKFSNAVVDVYDRGEISNPTFIGNSLARLQGPGAKMISPIVDGDAVQFKMTATGCGIVTPVIMNAAISSGATNFLEVTGDYCYLTGGHIGIISYTYPNSNTPNIINWTGNRGSLTGTTFHCVASNASGSGAFGDGIVIRGDENILTGLSGVVGNSCITVSGDRNKIHGNSVRRGGAISSELFFAGTATDNYTNHTLAIGGNSSGTNYKVAYTAI
jgi:hypothetical protein